MSGHPYARSGLNLLHATVLQVRAAGPGADGWLLSVTSDGSSASPGALTPPAAPPPSCGDAEHDRVAALVVLAQQGDKDAFAQIYDSYVDSIYRYLYYRVGSHPLAEDLTSETFLRALRRLDTFTWQGRDIGAWFVTIARNLVADHFKSSRFRLEISTADLLDAERSMRAGAGAGGGGVEDSVLDGLQNAALIETLRRLNPAQQECLVLRFLEGFSVAETARACGRSEGAVKQLQLRAVRSLAKHLPDGVR